MYWVPTGCEEMRNLIPLPCPQVSVNVPQSMFFLQLKDVNICCTLKYFFSFWTESSIIKQVWEKLVQTKLNKFYLLFLAFNCGKIFITEMHFLHWQADSLTNTSPGKPTCHSFCLLIFCPLFKASLPFHLFWEVKIDPWNGDDWVHPLESYRAGLYP